MFSHVQRLVVGGCLCLAWATVEAQITVDSFRSRTVFQNEVVAIDTSNSFEETGGNPLIFSADGLPAGLVISTAGLISGSTAASNQFFKVTVTASNNMGTDRSFSFQLRVLPRSSLMLSANLPGDYVLRCSDTGLNGNGVLTSTVDFSTPGQCPPQGRDECSVPDASATMINVMVEVDIDHPRVGDLRLTLTAPSATEVELFDDAEDICAGSGIEAVFDNSAPWPASSRCNQPETAIAGPLSPSQSLSVLRNQSPVGGPWTLTLDNVGQDSATLVRWCLALQVNDNGNAIFPQTDLPGTARAVYLDNTQSLVDLTGNLTRADQVDWFLVTQSFPCLVDTTVTQMGAGVAPRLFRVPAPQAFAEEPFAFPASCQPSSTSVTTGNIFVTAGVEHVRVQTCPDSPGGLYQISFGRDVSFCRPPPLGSSGGVVNGSVEDLVTGQPIGGVFVESEEGGGYFSDGSGSFSGLYTAGEYPLNLFHPAYAPLQTAPVTVIPRSMTSIGTVSLSAASYTADLNDRMFESGFEAFEGN